MSGLDPIAKNLLEQVADLHGVPMGAYNIRADGASGGRFSTANIEISSKTDKPGIDIKIKSGTVGESVHIPVVITKSGHEETVYNDFFIGENCDVLIVAGCGIHNGGAEKSSHAGIHTFYVGRGSRVRYVEKHYGEGDGTGGKIMDPQTVVCLSEGAFIELDTAQIRGIDSTKRYTKIVCEKDAEAVITERLMTHGDQLAVSDMDVFLNGDGSSTKVVSRSVAKDSSKQIFHPNVTGNAACFGHVQCDSIIMDSAQVQSIPAITANHVDAQLVHEAAIGKIAGDQLLKLMTLGLTEEEAEERIVSGFLK